MPAVPNPAAVPHIWHWTDLYPLAQRAGDLIPVGRGGERRAIAIANPGLAPMPYATPTIVGGHPISGSRRNSAAASSQPERFSFRFGGRWGLDGRRRRPGGDASRRSADDRGVAVPRPPQPESGTYGMARRTGYPAQLTHRCRLLRIRQRQRRASLKTPQISRSERLWAHPGLRPVSAVENSVAHSPLAAYRWEATDAALRAQLELEAEGYPGVI